MALNIGAQEMFLTTTSLVLLVISIVAILVMYALKFLYERAGNLELLTHENYR